MDRIYDQIYAACQPYWQVRDNDRHVPEAYRFAQELLLHYPDADASIVLPAILMHDNGYANVPEETLFQGLVGAPIGYQADITRLHEIEGAKIARKILQSFNYDPSKIDMICTIIDGHDSRKESLSFEDSVVKDADKLWRFCPLGVEITSQWMEMEPMAFLTYCVSKIEQWFFTTKAKEIALRLTNEAGAE